MPQCRRCKNSGMLLSVSQSGLCKACRDELTGQVTRLSRLIRNAEVLARHDESADHITEQCRAIIASASELLPFEDESISIPDKPFADIIEMYTSLHDLHAVQDSDIALLDTLARVSGELMPYSGLYGVRAALDSIGDLRERLGVHTHPIVLALINHKGGVGKTTSTINLGGGLSRLGKRVLLVDFDPQANLTDGMGFTDSDSFTHSVYDVVTGTAGVEDSIIRLSSSLALLPANVFLSRMEREFTRTTGNVVLLRNVLKQVTGYDYILIDCPPSLGILTLNALAATDHVIIPLQPEYYALKGIVKLKDAINYVQSTINNGISILGIIGTRYDSRKTLHREVLGKIRESFGDELFYAPIRENIALSEASSFGQQIYDYRPDCHGAEDYLELSRLVIEHTLPKRES